MKKLFTSKLFIYFLGIILFFLLWLIVSLIINEPIRTFPNPFDTIQEGIKILGENYFYISLLHSLLKMAIGFIIAFFLGLIIGTFAGNNSNIEQLFKPTMIVLKSIPTAVMVLLFIRLAGGAKYAPIWIVTLISFPIIYESVVEGHKNIDPTYLDALALDNKRRIKGELMIKLPLSFPYIMVGIISSLALSFKIEIMAEIVSGDTGYGLGVAIYQAQANNIGNMIPVFAYAFDAILVVLILSIGFYYLRKYFQKKI